MQEQRSKKGFTMAELLIVVAGNAPLLIVIAQIAGIVRVCPGAALQSAVGAQKITKPFDSRNVTAIEWLLLTLEN